MFICPFRVKWILTHTTIIYNACFQSNCFSLTISSGCVSGSTILTYSSRVLTAFLLCLLLYIYMKKKRVKSNGLSLDKESPQLCAVGETHSNALLYFPHS